MNCFKSIFALDLASVSKFPLLFNGAIPILSCLLLFVYLQKGFVLFWFSPSWMTLLTWSHSAFRIFRFTSLEKCLYFSHFQLAFAFLYSLCFFFNCFLMFLFNHGKSNKVAKIRNRYNQVPHLTQDTNGKVTSSKKTPQTRAKRSALSQQELFFDLDIFEGTFESIAAYIFSLNYVHRVSTFSPDFI